MVAAVDTAADDTVDVGEGILCVCIYKCINLN